MGEKCWSNLFYNTDACTKIPVGNIKYAFPCTWWQKNRLLPTEGNSELEKRNRTPDVFIWWLIIAQQILEFPTRKSALWTIAAEDEAGSPHPWHAGGREWAVGDADMVVVEKIFVLSGAPFGVQLGRWVMIEVFFKTVELSTRNKKKKKLLCSVN